MASWDPRREAQQARRRRCAEMVGDECGHSMRICFMFSGVRIPSWYQHRSHIPLVGRGLRHRRGPMRKASICTRYMVSFRLGLRPREIRGRIMAPRIVVIEVLGWLSSSIHVVPWDVGGLWSGSRVRGGVHW